MSQNFLFSHSITFSASQNAIRAKKLAEKEQDEREDNESVDNDDESSGLLDLISNEANNKSGTLSSPILIVS